MDQWLNDGVKGGASWPREETKVNFGGHELILRPATKNTEQSIHVNLRNISIVDAMTLVNRFLSVLSWCDDQPMENHGGWAGNPMPVSVPRETRMVGSSIAFPFGRELEENSKARLALALFREGQTVNSISFQFLSYFKILNIFWNDRYVNGKNDIIEGIRQTLPNITDEQAQKRLTEIKDMEADVSAYLYQSGRWAVAHAYADPIIDPDDTSDLRRLSQDLWIIKAIAEYLIVSELRISRSIIG